MFSLTELPNNQEDVGKILVKVSSPYIFATILDLFFCLSFFWH